MVDEHRLVTVVGPGGAGKTRLAHEMAGRWRDRARCVDGRAGRPPRPGGRDRRRGRSPSGSGAGPDQASAAGSRPGGRPHRRAAATVLVLDNCEHVISEAARVTEHLLRACPELRVVATSREALGIGGETLWPVPPHVRRRRGRAVRGPGDGGAVASTLLRTPEPAIDERLHPSRWSSARDRAGRGADASDPGRAARHPP